MAPMVTNCDSGNIGANSDNSDPLETMVMPWSYNGANSDNNGNGDNGFNGSLSSISKYIFSSLSRGSMLAKSLHPCTLHSRPLKQKITGSNPFVTNPRMSALRAHLS